MNDVNKNLLRPLKSVKNAAKIKTNYRKKLKNEHYVYLNFLMIKSHFVLYPGDKKFARYHILVIFTTLVNIRRPINNYNTLSSPQNQKRDSARVSCVRCIARCTNNDFPVVLRSPVSWNTCASICAPKRCNTFTTRTYSNPASSRVATKEYTATWKSITSTTFRASISSRRW